MLGEVDGAAGALHGEPSPVAVTRDAIDAQEWDAFVRRAPGGTFFHLSGWKETLERTFGLRAHTVVARREERIVGVLPLFELRAPLMTARLLSIPFAVEGGVCADDDEARSALDRAALDLARQRGIDEVELRDGFEAPGFRLREGRYFRFGRPLHPSDEANLAATPAKRRYMVRLGERNGLEWRVDTADLPAFYDLYARTARHFGTPVFPVRFFQNLLGRLPGDVALLTVRLADTPVASALLLFFRDTVTPYYVGSRRDFFRYAVNDFLYWQAMRYAQRRGACWFDFGRSKLGTGAYAFKCHWGCTPAPLRYRVHADSGAPSERSTTDPNLQWLLRAWQRLPLSVTKLLGPSVVARYGAFYT